MRSPQSLVFSRLNNNSSPCICNLLTAMELNTSCYLKMTSLKPGRIVSGIEFFMESMFFLLLQNLLFQSQKESAILDTFSCKSRTILEYF